MVDRKKRGDIGKEKSKSSKSKKSGKRVKRIHLERADSGELLARHEHHPKTDGTPEPDETHVVPQGGLDEHVEQNMPQETEAMAAPAPQPGGQMGGM